MKQTSQNSAKLESFNGKIQLAHQDYKDNIVVFETIDNKQPLNDLSNVLSITYNRATTTREQQQEYFKRLNEL